MDNQSSNINSSAEQAPVVPPTLPIPPKPKFKIPILPAVIIALLLIVGSASAAYLLVKKLPSQTACRMEAKLCPDGLSVGRTGPNCSFTPCPISKPKIDTSTWKTYRNTKYNYSVLYPRNLQATDETPFSSLFNIVQTEPGPLGFPIFYISVIPNGFTNNDSSVYNFIDDNTIKKFNELKKDQTLNLSEASPGFEFTRLEDIIIENQKAIVMENKKPWEYPGKDRRIFINKNNLTYEIGTYYQTQNEFNNFLAFLSTFKFTNTAEKNTNIAGPGEPCGGIIGKPYCVKNYDCIPNPQVTVHGDAPGICVFVDSPNP